MIPLPPMKVLLVTARYFPLMGGVETHVYEVARRFARDGVDVTVLTTDPSGALEARERRDGVNIIRVPAYPPKADLYVAPSLYGVVADGDWDIIHCQGFHTFVPPVAMLAARRARIPYVLSFHSGGHSSGFRHSIRSLQSSALRPLLAHAEKLIAVSRFEARLFAGRLGLPAERFVVIPNGSQLPPVANVPTDPSLILSVGRLERYKGHQRILAALPKILETRPDVRLRILGKGPYEAELRSLADQLGVAERVEIGAVPPENRQGMASIVAGATLSVFLSEYEAHPISVMEALSLGRSVLVADTSGLTELAERGLVRAIPLGSTAEQVAAAALEQLAHPLVPDRIDLPTWDQCAEALLTLYSDVLRKPAWAF